MSATQSAVSPETLAKAESFVWNNIPTNELCAFLAATGIPADQGERIAALTAPAVELVAAVLAIYMEQTAPVEGKPGDTL